MNFYITHLAIIAVRQTQIPFIQTDMPTAFLAIQQHKDNQQWS
ncbi:hypothetical protein P022_gp14 [Pelagibacter phage HTVC022P]|nr:hypothetical protein P022_gp14 [Pelagibacter phage HTVC022P]